MIAWILVLFSPLGNVETIDNISSVEACQQLGQEMRQARLHSDLRFRCFSVEKISHPEPPA